MIQLLDSRVRGNDKTKKLNMDKKYILNYEIADIEKQFLAAGQDRFRVNQVLEWAYKKKVDSFDKCTNLPASFRTELANTYSLRELKLSDVKASKKDGTERFHFKAADGLDIFTVYLPGKDRNSICISSQVGCPVGCAFCFSGKVKFKRNLTRGEILEQILQVENKKGININSVLFMGMGEPLLNYDNVVSALKALTDFREFGMGRRHITVSTVGFVPQIRKLADEILGIRLALSLHAPDDEIRNKLVTERIPYTVNEILKAGLYFSRKNSSRLTIEYILIAKVNDTMASAKKFVKLLERASKPKDEIQVNLIPFNDTENVKFHMPSGEAMQRFKNFLNKNGVLAMIRNPRGADIGSACGQLGI